MSMTQGPPADSQGQVIVTIAGAGPAVSGHVQDLMTDATGILAGYAGSDAGGTVGVYGTSNSGVGVFGTSTGWDGVQGRTTHPQHAGVAAVNDVGIAVYGRGVPAGHFQGDVKVFGDLSVTGDVYLINKDLAERFNGVPSACPPGAVVVMRDDGTVGPADAAYDPRVVGIVTGAGGPPAVTLGAGDDPASSVRVALVGTVTALADAAAEPIHVGDLLTSSPTPGHAMAATDRSLREGAVVGKALTALPSGQGVVRVLVLTR